MTQGNVEVIRAVYEAWNRRDFDAVLNDAHPDFEIRPLRAIAQDPRRGHTAAKEFWAEFFEGFEEMRVEPRELLEVGKMVVADLRFSGRGRYDVEVEQFHADLWTFRDGRLAAVEGFATRADALEAAGLRG